MKKYPLIKLAVPAALILCLFFLKVNAQSNQSNETNPYPVLSKVRPHSNPDAEGEPIPIPDVEVGPIVDRSNLKSNDPSYNYSPKWDYFVDGIKWINKFLGPIIRSLPGGSGSSLDPNPFSSNNDYSFSNTDHGPFSQKFVNDSYLSYGSQVNSTNHKNQYLSIGFGLGIGTRGAKEDGAITNILYLQLPIILVRYNYILPGAGTLFVQAGGYYATALSGTFKGPGDKAKLKFGNDTDNDDYRRGDFGLKFGAGYKLNNLPILIGLTTDIGLHNIIPGGDRTNNTHNRSYGLQVAYIFR